MVEHIKSVISTYEQRLMEISYVPRTSYGPASVGDEGDTNNLFLTYLLSDKDFGIQFLKDVELLRNNATCNTCG